MGRAVNDALGRLVNPSVEREVRRDLTDTASQHAIQTFSKNLRSLLLQPPLRFLRDYVYIPLGGNRGGALKTFRNLFLTMTIGGLWHGAAWTFVAWGALHGVLLMISHRRDRPIRTGLRSIPSVVVTFGMVTVAWIFFRADTLSGALDYIGGIVTLQGGTTDWSLLVLLLFTGPLLLALDLAQRFRGDDAFLASLPSPLQGLTVGAAVLLLVVFSGGAGEPFIYFQF